MSSVFVGRHKLPETALAARNSVACRTTSGPVVVPASTGMYSCYSLLVVGHLVGADVCLGRDWLTACSIELLEPLSQDPPQDAISRLPTGVSCERRECTALSHSAA